MYFLEDQDQCVMSPQFLCCWPFVPSRLLEFLIAKADVSCMLTANIFWPGQVLNFRTYTWQEGGREAAKDSINSWLCKGRFFKRNSRRRVSNSSWFFRLIANIWLYCIPSNMYRILISIKNSFLKNIMFCPSDICKTRGKWFWNCTSSLTACKC